MKNILDLRKKLDPQVRVVEKIIFKRQPWYFEIAKITLAIIIVSTIVWGVSKADDFINPQKSLPAKSFSAVGTVTEITPTSLSVDVENKKEVFDISSVSSVQTNHFVQLSLSDIKIGDNIILQGIERNETIKIFKIYSYGTEVATGILTQEDSPVIPEVATSTATTTLDVATSTATTTDEIATTTEETSTSTQDTASSTPIIEIVSDTIGDIVDKAKDTIQDIIEVITGTSTENVLPQPEPEIVPTVVEPIPEPTLQETPSETVSQGDTPTNQ